MPKGEVSYEVVKKIGVLSESEKGWKKEVRLIKWNGRPAKIDVRDWAPDDERMGRGLSITNEEARKLREVLQGMDL